MAVSDESCLHAKCLSSISRMCRTSEYVQLRLLSFYKSNLKIAKVVRELFSEGIKIDRKTVAKYYKQFRLDLRLGDLPRSGRPPKLQRRHFDCLRSRYTVYVFNVIRRQFLFQPGQRVSEILFTKT